MLLFNNFYFIINVIKVGEIMGLFSKKMENKKESKKIYSINRSKILEGGAEMVPPYMWFYKFDEGNKIYNISLALYADKELLPSYLKDVDDKFFYVDVFNTLAWFTDTDLKSAKLILPNDIKKGMSERLLTNNGSDIKVGFHPFVDGCLNEDVYNNEDFISINNLVTKYFFESDDNFNKSMVNAENIRENIIDIHREYMGAKMAVNGDSNVKYHFYKQLRYFKNNKFSIDNSTILNCETKRLPKLKWVFLQDENNPNIIKIDLAVLSNKLPGWSFDEYVSIYQPNLYELNDNEYVHDKNIPEVFSEKINKFQIDFVDSVLPDDVYTLENLKELLKYVSDEINSELVSYEGDEENIMMNTDKVLNAKVLNYRTVETLIKNAHKQYRKDMMK